MSIQGELRVLATLAAVALAAGPTAADTADDFGWVFVAEIKADADMAAVDALAAEIVAAASVNSGTLTYEFARVGNMLYGFELFDNSAAFMSHLKTVEPMLPRMFESWSPTQIVPTRELPADVAEMMANFGIATPDMTFALDR